MSSEAGKFFRENWISIVLIALMVATVIGMGALIVKAPNQTPREIGFASVILTAASILGSVLVTRIYSSGVQREIFRNSGVQIASDIMVLNRQLESLVDWIDQKRLLKDDAMSVELNDAALEHIRETLIGFRSLTSAALGGIAGVIGDALAQYKAVMEQIDTIREEAQRKSRELQEQIERGASKEEIDEVRVRLQRIESDARAKILEVSSHSVLPIPETPSMREFECRCPYCSRPNRVLMRDRSGETREVRCDSCDRRFNSHLAAGLIVVRSIGDAEDLTAFQEQARRAIKKRKAWLEPRFLRQVIPLVEECDRVLRESKDGRSPAALQASLIGNDETLNRIGVSKFKLRCFFRNLLNGGAFEFEHGSDRAFPSRYVNELKAASLLQVYVAHCTGCVLKSGLERPDDWERELVDLLLGEVSEPEFSLARAAVAQTFLTSKERANGLSPLGGAMA